MATFVLGRRSFALAAVLFVLSGLFAAIPASATPGVPPNITSIASADQDIDPGETRTYNVAVTGYDTGGTWSFSGTGLTVTAVQIKTNGVRLTITASLTAAPGVRSLTAVNPDGLSDTLTDAITVTGTGGATGDVTGHVYSDTDGDGVEDAGETGLAAVDVDVVDSAAVSHSVATDSSGNWTVAGLPTGSADVTFTTPAGYTLTTANASQTLTVTDGGTATAADVGYEPPSGTAPVVVGFTDADKDIDPGEVRNGRLEVLNYQTGGTVTFSGTGLTATVSSVKGNTLRLRITATSTAATGWRTVTVTNPDSLSGSLANAFFVNAGAPVESGDVTGHVFSDLDGNGVENGSDTALAGVSVSFLDAAGTAWPGTTDASGNFTLTVGIGQGTLTVTTPPGQALTTGNAVQLLTVTDGGSTAATPVGYMPGATGGTFVDVASAVGINYTHVINDCGGPIGIGAAWADVDNDGDQDLYTTNQIGPNHMYLNSGDTSGDGIPDFVDSAVSLGIDAASLDSYAAVFADVDNDGDQDLYFSSDDGNKLYRNEFANNGGTLAFTNRSTQSGLTDTGKVETATFGDVDGDGVLDLYLAKHMSCVGDNTDRLWHGDGDGTFTDWTTWLCGGGAVPCSTVDGLGFAAGIADFDRDGDNDIYLVNDNIGDVNQPNKMIRNDGSNGTGGWIFTEVGAATGTDLSVNGMGLGMGDYDNDGWIDLAFSDANPGHLLSNDGDGTYTDISVSSGVDAATNGQIGWGTAFLDYDNDGWQDLFFANGGIGTDAPYANSLLANNGGTFTDVAPTTGMAHTGRGRSVALADFDGDGWVDVFVGNYGQAPVLMHNQSEAGGNTNNHLVITVEGTVSNRDGIGTELRLTTAEGVQFQLISSGSNHGGGSQKAAFFGLGGATGGTLSVTWPNGVVQNLGTVTTGTLHLVEPAA